MYSIRSFTSVSGISARAFRKDDENTQSNRKRNTRSTGLLLPILFEMLITLNGLLKMKEFTLYFKAQDPNSKFQVPREK
jgi:hypothetical protein